MKTLAELKQWLELHPDIRSRSDDKQLTIHAKDESGFDITVIEDGTNATVYFDGWHDHFDTMEEALQCAGFGLSGKSRIKVDRRGSSPYQWTLEYRDGDEWAFESSTSLIFYPYWRTRNETYLQNNHDIEP
ncbi:MAG: hypothetical protein AAFW74_02580, partial [Pseudomonadota bacterium]